MAIVQSLPPITPGPDRELVNSLEVIEVTPPSASGTCETRSLNCNVVVIVSQKTNIWVKIFGWGPVLDVKCTWTQGSFSPFRLLCCALGQPFPIPCAMHPYLVWNLPMESTWHIHYFAVSGMKHEDQKPWKERFILTHGSRGIRVFCGYREA